MLKPDSKSGVKPETIRVEAVSGRGFEIWCSTIIVPRRHGLKGQTSCLVPLWQGSNSTIPILIPVFQHCRLKAVLA